MIKTEEHDIHHERSWLDRLLHVFAREPQDRDQLLALLRDAEQRDVIKPDALGMIEGALQVANMQVDDVMIPRSQTVSINEDLSLGSIIQQVNLATHSRYPVLNREDEKVVGILHAKDLLQFFAADKAREFDLDDILRPASFVPESQSLDVLLKDFLSKCNHMAIVVDEYGHMSGVVTIENVIEQIVGDIEDEFDANEDSYIKKHGDRDYIIKAITPIEDINAYFDVAFSDEEFDTIGGLVLQAFGYMPKRGEKIDLDQFTIEVLHADKRRLRLLKLHRNL